jgi:hypothetical protein
MEQEMIKTWQEKSKRRALAISASQIATKRRCPRQWWFEKVRRLPTPMIKGGVFGSVLHAVCERYLLANDLGRDSNGQPVDLYPVGWEISYNKYTKEEEGRLTPAEQATVNVLIAKGIEEGVLERLPNRKVEEQFNFVVNKPEIPSGGNCTVNMVGFIDVLMPGEVQDHKTSKDKKYFLSKAKLKTNSQVLIYAYYEIKRIKEQGGSIPKTIKLRHNQYCKDPNKPSIRKTEVEVKTVDVLAHWKQVEADAKDMVILRDSTQEFHDIPDPENPQKTCRAYGGCPYLTVCFGRESPEVYEDRMTRYLNHTPSKEISMASPFAAKVLKLSAVNPPVQAVTPPADEPITLAMIGTWPEQAAPWAKEGACGFNEKGQPNQVDDAMCRQAGGYTSDMFLIYAPIDGFVPVQGKPGTPAAALRLRCPMTASPVAAVRVTKAITPQEGAPDLVAEETAAIENEEEAPLPEPEEPMTPEDQAAYEHAIGGDPMHFEPEEVIRQPIPKTELDEMSTPLTEEAKEARSLAEPEEPQQARSTGKAKKRGKAGKSFMLMLGVTSSYGYYRKGSGRFTYDAFQVWEDVKAEIAVDNDVEFFEDLDVWKRRDMIRSKGAEIAEGFRTDIVQVATTVVSPDMQAFIDAIRPYAGNVFCGISC